MVALFLAFAMSSLSSAETIQLGVPGTVESLDPTTAEDFATVRLLMNIGAGLVKYDKDLKIVPNLAKNWKFNFKSQSFNFELGDHYWSDGKKITSGDFARALKRAIDPSEKAKLALALRDAIESISTPTESQIIIQLKKPALYLISHFALPFSFPQRSGKTYRDVASGSFTIKTFRRGSKIVLTPNKRSSNPALQDVSLSFFREPMTAYQLFKKGKLHLVERVPGAVVASLKSSSPELNAYDFLATYYIGFGVQSKPFNNKSLRAAVAMSLDKNQILKIITPPQKQAQGFVPSALKPADVREIPFDPEKAKEIWKESKGPRSIRLMFDGQEKNRLVGQFIQAELKKHLGINVTLKEMEWKAYLNSLSQDHPAFYRFAWLAPYPDAMAYLNVFRSDSPNNYSQYKNSDYDTLLSRIEALKNGSQRDELVKQAQQTLIDDAVLIPLFHYKEYFVKSPSLRGLDPTPMGILYLDQADLEPLPDTAGVKIRVHAWHEPAFSAL